VRDAAAIIALLMMPRTVSLLRFAAAAEFSLIDIIAAADAMLCDARGKDVAAMSLLTADITSLPRR